MNPADERHQEIKELYAAFNRRDLDAVLAHLAPDVRWANGWEGGYVEGHKEVRDYWMRQFESIQPQVEPERISTADDGGIVVEVHQVVSSLNGDQLADERVVHRFTFLGDLISRFDIG